MSEQKRISGNERRESIRKLLAENGTPITGGELAAGAGVSRQVIVQDISLLKAKGEPIIATSQGYLYLEPSGETPPLERVIACKHTPEETKKELQLIVDHGVTVKDVFIEHPIYGDLSASIMVSNRNEADEFIRKIQAANAPYLLELTNDGVHLHTLLADSEEKLDAAYASLEEAGMVIEN